MLQRYERKYEENLFESVLPFWLRHSLDREHGGYFTALNAEGQVYDTRKYVWLNGRQVWTLSKLYNEAGGNPEWLDAARLGAEFLRKHVFDERGRCWFSLTRDGKPAFFQRKPYGAAFVMLGFNEFARATGEASYRDTAQELFRRIRTWIADPTLLGRPASQASLLADVYIVLSMGLETGDHDAVREMLAAIDVHWHAPKRLFLENAVLDESRRFEYPEGRLICAGSNFEIAWLLLDALEIFPDENKKQMVLAALEGALEFGWDREHGGFFYFQDVEGAPTLQLESSMKLWWVHAEAILALVRAYEVTRDIKWLRWLEAVDEYTFSHFPDARYGEWFGYLDRYGRPTHTLKGNNYKGCFHIPRALWLSLKSMRRCATSSR